MIKNKQMKFIPHPEISLLQSAVNEVIENHLNPQSPTNNKMLSANITGSSLSNTNGSDEAQIFLDAAENYCKAAADTLGIEVKGEKKENPVKGVGEELKMSFEKVGERILGDAESDFH